MTDIVIIPEEKVPIGDPLSLTINFTLDRDCVAAYWVFKVCQPHSASVSLNFSLILPFALQFDVMLIQLLVDSSFKRIIKGMMCVQ